MINFPQSTFTWKAHPRKPHPYYRYDGGFVGKYGQVYQVRFNIDAKCNIRDEATDQVAELFLGAPCRGEYTIAASNLIMIPSTEFRMAFSRQSRLTIARRPSTEREDVFAERLSERFQDYRIDLRSFDGASELKDARQIVEATLANDLMNARSTYRDSARRLSVTVEYPINLINVNEADGEFQVCTGPVFVPDLATWDGGEVSRVFLAEVAFSRFDHVELILRREAQPSDEEKGWLHVVRGRDRSELSDPNVRPPDHLPPRPALTAYNEVWELEATNVVLRAERR